MGRAFEVRKASMMKTGAAKSKLYTIYSKEVYQAAKNGGTSPDSNPTLKRIIERAKKEQVPSDVIKRAIDKVNSGVDENYSSVVYEIFGPGGSTLMVECLTDNVNRTISFVRPALNKNEGKMGVSGSVGHSYDHLAVVSFTGLAEDEVFELMIENDVDVVDVESDEEHIVVYGQTQDLNRIKEVILLAKSDMEFDVQEIVYIPQMKVTLEGDDLEHFKKMYAMLDEVEDVQKIYHNVDLEG